MGDQSTYRSWAGSATDDEAKAERRRERVHGWVRLGSIGVALAVVLFDGLVLVVASGIQTAVRVRSGRSCDTFWTELAHDTLTGVWVVLGLVAVTLLASVWRRWIFVAVLVVQLGAMAILIPNLVHKHNEYLAVAEGRLNPVNVDTGGVACS